ncbi:MAG: DUF1329 domain-containing protein [Gammaproteobacteria bacterium]|nr:DUF1329 domain-containing protein [Gammaproteobacteria bacterium]
MTPVGAERAGNDSGSIPPWDGGLVRAATSVDAVEHEVDPFSEDNVIATITAANLDRFASQLSEGQRAMFAHFASTWRMRVFPTRRSAAFPEWVYEAMHRNGEIAAASTDVRSVISKVRVTSPFPRPASGEEVVWNHVLRWRGIHVVRNEGVAAVTPRADTAGWSTQDIAFLRRRGICHVADSRMSCWRRSRSG